jgi:hypothetical protein
MKVDIKLEFEGWVAENQAPAFELNGNPDDITIADVITGSIEISPGRLYEIMKAHKVDGVLPLFRMVIVDPEDEKKQAELKRLQKQKEKEPELDLDPKEDEKKLLTTPDHVC